MIAGHDQTLDDQYFYSWAMHYIMKSSPLHAEEWYQGNYLNTHLKTDKQLQMFKAIYAIVLHAVSPLNKHSE